MKKRLYVAYGSNLNIRQMKHRCPTAKLYGVGTIEDYELQFKGQPNGAFATIAPKEGSSVPVAVWEIQPKDEISLDRYEGFPNFYYKRDIRLQYKGIRTGKRRTVTAFAYIMHEERPIGIPTNFYMRTCLEGYTTFHFNKNILIDAYNKCLEVCGYEE